MRGSLKGTRQWMPWPPTWASFPSALVGPRRCFILLVSLVYASLHTGDSISCNGTAPIQLTHTPTKQQQEPRWTKLWMNHGRKTGKLGKNSVNSSPAESHFHHHLSLFRRSHSHTSTFTKTQCKQLHILAKIMNQKHENPEKKLGKLTPRRTSFP